MRAALALGLGVLLMARTASADETYFFGRGRLQAGLITEARPQRDVLEDLHLDAIPEVGLYRGTTTSQLTLSYTLTAVVHTAYSNELGQRLALADSMDLGPRTGLTLGASASRTTLGNILLTQPASGGAAGLFPATSTTIITTNANQGLTHDLSRNVRLDQEATASAFRTLTDGPNTRSYYASLGGGLERVWQNDGVGGSVLAGYSFTKAPPAADQSLLLFTAGPRWRHDWSRTLSSLVEAGISVVKSANHDSSPYYAPSARVSVPYTTDDVQLTFAASTGVTPNPLTGQLVQAHEGSVHIVTPLSLPKHVFLEGSLGYTHGSLIDRENTSRNLDYDSILADLGLIWELTPHVETYARYTFTAQDGSAATGQDVSFLRNSVLIGIQISSRPLITRGGARAGGLAGPQGAPQRVDRTDGRSRAPSAQPDPPPANMNAEPSFRPARDDDD